MFTETRNTFVWTSNVYQEVGLRSLVTETRNTFVWASNVYLEVGLRSVITETKILLCSHRMYTRK